MSAEQIKKLTEKLEQCGHEDASVIANRVFNLGYRKQSDTIKEFAEKLTTKLLTLRGGFGIEYIDCRDDAIRELENLAKEYGVEVDE